jgi:hypothetical protein
MMRVVSISLVLVASWTKIVYTFTTSVTNVGAGGSMSTTMLNQAAAATTSTSSTTTKIDNAFGDFVNEAEILKQSTFPILPDKLIERAKEVLSPNIGLGTKDGGECLADNFEFCAAVIGPIGKAEYLKALGNFNLADSFDITGRNFGFSVDPFQPNRVWFFSRVKAVHTGTFMGAQPTGKEITYPPQIHHIDFNNDGKIIEFGFYTSDRRQGNTGGLGGAFGFMYAVGRPLPIPECQPYKPSIRLRLLTLIGKLADKFAKK